MSKPEWSEVCALLGESARLSAREACDWLMKPLRWCYDKAESNRWRLGVLLDIEKLEEERRLVADSERFYGGEVGRLCVRMGHEIASGDVESAESLHRQMQICRSRCAAETERLKQLSYEIEHRKHLLHRGRPVGLRQE